MALPYNKEDGEWGKEAERALLKLLRDDYHLDISMPERQFENRADYAKYEYDFIIEHPEDPNISIIGECKRREIRFTSHLDFPYPTVIVDAYSTYNSKKRRPFMYFIANKDLTHFFAVSGLSKKHWTKNQRYNQKKGAYDWYYECPKEQCISIQSAVDLIKVYLAGKKPTLF